MLKQQLKHKKKQQGFTLLEILVVVAIMGFLVAMVAPRFAGITDGTVDVVCDTNQQRMVSALSTYYEQNGSLPGGLVNLVDFDETNTDYYRPTHTGELEFSDEGQATFFQDFYDRNQFEIHILNDAEASEMRSLGVTSVQNLNAYNYKGIDDYAFTEIGEDDQAQALQRVSVDEELGVLMIGMGADASDGDLDGGAIRTDAGLLDYLGWGNPEWLGRIILGVGPDSALVKEGMISAAGLCPGGINNEQVFWNNYNVVLPRLEATTERIDNGSTLTGLLAKSVGGSYRTFDLTEAQEGFEFLTQCPEGHRWPTPDESSSWAIYAGGNLDPDNPEGDLETAEVIGY